MGLPSGLQWASHNIGVEYLGDLGLYFSWGNTEGHRLGEGYDFTQAEYDTTPGKEISANLSLDQDAARAYLGEPWRMPTAAEFQELFDNSTSVWTTQNGVNGFLLTSNVNGNKLFFPANGGFNGTSLNNRGAGGAYWSSTYATYANARLMRFSSSEFNPNYTTNRRYGFSIRAVLQPT